MKAIKSNSMKTIVILAIAIAAGSVARAEDHKHPSDPCPKGQHEVKIERTTTVRGDLGGGAHGGIVEGHGSVGGEKTTREMEKVCRDTDKAPKDAKEPKK